MGPWCSLAQGSCLRNIHLASSIRCAAARAPSWGTRIRTLISGARIRCPAVRRSPKVREEKHDGAIRGAMGEAGRGRRKAANTIHGWPLVKRVRTVRRGSARIPAVSVVAAIGSARRAVASCRLPQFCAICRICAAAPLTGGGKSLASARLALAERECQEALPALPC